MSEFFNSISEVGELLKILGQIVFSKWFILISLTVIGIGILKSLTSR